MRYTEKLTRSQPLQGKIHVVSQLRKIRYVQVKTDRDSIKKINWCHRIWMGGLLLWRILVRFWMRTWRLVSCGGHYLLENQQLAGMEKDAGTNKASQTHTSCYSLKMKYSCIEGLIPNTAMFRGGARSWLDHEHANLISGLTHWHVHGWVCCWEVGPSGGSRLLAAPMKGSSGHRPHPLALSRFASWIPGVNDFLPPHSSVMMFCLTSDPKQQN